MTFGGYDFVRARLWFCAQVDLLEGLFSCVHGMIFWRVRFCGGSNSVNSNSVAFLQFRVEFSGGYYCH